MRITLDLLIALALTAFICSADLVFDSNPQNATSDRSADYFAAMCSSRRHARYFRDSILRPILQERVSGSEGNARVRQHIKTRMLELGWVVDEDQFEADTPVGRRRFTNVVAVLDPRSSSRMTLACHYDSKQFDNDVIESFVGATDAAASCAILIDLVTCLNESLHQSRRQTPPAEKSVQLIFFDGEEAIVDWTEEDSLYGSRHLAQVMANELLAPSGGNEVEPGGRRSLLDAMDLMVLLDLVGSKETKFVNWFPQTSHLYNRLSHIESQLWSSNALKPPAVNDYGVDDAALADNPLRYFRQSYYRYLGGGIQDDHLPFLARGVPVLHLITYPFPEVWHTEADNETVLDYTVISNVATILRVFLAEYLNLP